MQALNKTLLHIAPHCDDELIGAPAILMGLRDHGWSIVNLVSSLGSPDQRNRRSREVELACQKAGFELKIFQKPLDDPIAEDDFQASVRRSVAEISQVIEEVAPAIIMTASPLDKHLGHQAMGEALLRALEGNPLASQVVWLWGLWADLPYPTIAHCFGEDYLVEIEDCLALHAGELERNDYRRLVGGRAMMNSILGPERVFGFGSCGVDQNQYVELIGEFYLYESDWWSGSPRWLELANPLNGTRSHIRNPRSH